MAGGEHRRAEETEALNLGRQAAAEQGPSGVERARGGVGVARGKRDLGELREERGVEDVNVGSLSELECLLDDSARRFVIRFQAHGGALPESKRNARNRSRLWCGVR